MLRKIARLNKRIPNAIKNSAATADKAPSSDIRKGVANILVLIKIRIPITKDATPIDNFFSEILTGIDKDLGLKDKRCQLTNFN